MDAGRRMSPRARRAGAALTAVALLAACAEQGGEARRDPQQNAQAEAEPETVDIPQTVTAIAQGTTPMAERVAVLGLLNKRNGISRELTLKPGQAIRAGNVAVRLRACETTAPWEVQKLTGAFVQLDVRNPQGQVQRVFSGWIYKETPSLNVVEHPIYDVWPKSCAMTHPEAGESTVRAGSAAKSRSSAPNSAPASPRRSATPTAKARPAPASAEPVANADSNSAR
jgi:hypothetical protein